MAWHGMVWYGMVWYGMVWYGIVWYGIYGLETGVSVLLTNTRTRWPQNEREIFNTAQGVAECSIENFKFIVRPASG